MLITRLFLPSDEVSTLGLNEINMPRLGRYVAIAGKNGAGKSRLLTILEQKVTNRLNGIANLKTIRSNIKSLELTIQRNSSDDAVPQWNQELQRQKKQLADCTEYIFADEHLQFKSLRFVPKGLNLEDPQQESAQNIKTRADQASKANVENYQSFCLHYIQKLQNRWWSVSHQNFSGQKSEKQQLSDDYERLNGLILALLGANLDRNSDDEVTIFEKPIANAGLSDGQKVILQLAVALHAQKGTLDNTVFILDELENHLHPSAVIDLLIKITEAAPNSQVWIATHSVPLLAYIASIEPMAIWYMENGKISHSGRRPERVLKGLLGDDERIGQVQSFTGLPALLAVSNYAVESLLPPKTVIADEGDPQVSQISKVLNNLTGTKALSILDFGAGKGRLLEGLSAAMSSTEKIESKINYFAFDPYPTEKSVCCALINEHFGSSDGRYFEFEENFFSQKDDGCIDVVVMCNVLHEIHPSHWLQLFSDTSLIMRALNDNGYLLIVEDQRIPVGEKAHENGFLVLDTPQLKTLFNIKEADIAAGKFTPDDCRNDGRLKAHLVSKSLLQMANAQSRDKAITELRDSAINNIRSIRSKEPTYANGQLHGFWTQQLANAYMYSIENGQ